MMINKIIRQNAGEIFVPKTEKSKSVKLGNFPPEFTLTDSCHFHACVSAATLASIAN